MSNHINHPFHLVDKSPWPLLSAFRVITLVSGIAKWFHTFNIDLIVLGLITTTIIMAQWWRDVIREGTFQGLHTSIVGVGLRWGIILFLTWAHHAIIENNYTQGTQALLFTVFLGLYFTSLQALEYYEAPFSIADAVYGSTFFVATGFHGLHVIIGTIFLSICLVRHFFNHFSSFHHFGFEAAAWYWHFVDVVWLFLFISIYWWGN